MQIISSSCVGNVSRRCFLETCTMHHEVRDACTAFYHMLTWTTTRLHGPAIVTIKSRATAALRRATEGGAETEIAANFHCASNLVELLQQRCRPSRPVRPHQKVDRMQQ